MEKRNSCISIIGMPGSGKSTVGKLLSEALGLPFIDTDKEIENITGLTVPEIFERWGERRFREIEKEVVLRSLERRGVISLGGGAILNPEVREKILIKSTCFYLKTSIKEIKRRLKGKTEKRPLLPQSKALEEKLLSLYKKRRKSYEIANHVIECDGLSPEEVRALMTMLIEDETEPEEIPSHFQPIRLGRINFSELKSKPKITTREIYRIYAKMLGESRITLAPDGEEVKKLKNIEKIYLKLLDWNVERDGKIVAIGGGALTDAVGFVSSTFKRGCKLISVPTTLLAQIDASIGGKNAINVGEIKNAVGTFKFPHLTLVEPKFTLSQNERRFSEGLIEAIKIALVASEEFLSFMEANIEALKKRNLRAIKELIREAISLKLKIVERDPFEKNERRILNFGHTLGHALEAQLGLSHGEAVSLGMAMALKIGERLKISNKKAVERAISLLDRLGAPTNFENVNLLKLKDKISQDKKISRGKLNFILIRDIGKAEIRKMEVKEICEFLS